MMNEPVLCMDCRYWEPGEHDAETGQCRCNPPVVLFSEGSEGRSFSPVTARNFWCGRGIMEDPRLTPIEAAAFEWKRALDEGREFMADGYFAKARLVEAIKARQKEEL